MRLADAPFRQALTVENVGGERGFRRRLMELGLLPGTRVELVGVAPLGDPLELLVRGCSLSIRRSEAELVSVALFSAETAESLKTEAGRVNGFTPRALIARQVGGASAGTEPLHSQPTGVSAANDAP
jgi:ferrous iron transport protein A